MATSTVSSNDRIAETTELTQHVEVEARGKLFREKNPDAIVLDTAENVLIFEKHLFPLLNNGAPLTIDDARYPKTNTGNQEVREKVAALLSDSLRLSGTQRLRAEQIIGTSGVTGALYLHAVSRLSPGQPVLLPTPCWTYFMKVYDHAGLDPVAVPGDPRDGFALHLETIQKAHDELRGQGKEPQALVLTNPHNPLGTNYKRELLEAIYDWVLKKTNMQIVSDEIYAHSQFGRQEDFVSALALERSAEFDNRVSVMWGFSKDFGLSGFKGGVIISRSAEVIRDIGTNYARFSPFDSLKNFTFRKVLEAPQPLLEAYRQELRKTHGAIAEELDKQSIVYQRGAVAGQFFWLDLRAYLDDKLPAFSSPGLSLLAGPEATGDSREEKLHKYLSDKAQVVLLRGESMNCPVPGFFRMCFTCEDQGTVVEAVQRIGKALRALRP